MTPIYIDADLEDADWPKQTWDLDQIALDHWRLNASIEDIVAFTKLPAYRAAPPEVREAIEERLAAADAD